MLEPPRVEHLARVLVVRLPQRPGVRGDRVAADLHLVPNHPRRDDQRRNPDHERGGGDGLVKRRAPRDVDGDGHGEEDQLARPRGSRGLPRRPSPQPREAIDARTRRARRVLAARARARRASARAGRCPLVRQVARKRVCRTCRNSGRHSDAKTGRRWRLLTCVGYGRGLRRDLARDRKQILVDRLRDVARARRVRMHPIV